MRTIAASFILLTSCHFGTLIKTQVPSGIKAEPRLGWVAWPDADTFMFCRQRVNDDANAVGVPGPCYKQAATETDSKKMLSWLGGGGRDQSSPLAVPWQKCSLEYEAAQLVPQVTPARLWMKSPLEKKLLREWLPDTEGDAFVFEASFSPEGKWLAMLRLAVGLGEDIRLVEPVTVDIIPLPACS